MELEQVQSPNDRDFKLQSCFNRRIARTIVHSSLALIFQIIKVLLQCGAHLHGNAQLIGERMCAAASAGNAKRLRSYLLAGADLSQKDASGRTPLHFTALHNRTEATRFLLDHGADLCCVDMLGQTAADLAEAARATDVAHLLGSSGQNGAVAADRKISVNAST